MTDSEGRSRRSLPPRTAKRKPERDAKSGPLPKKKKTKKRVESDSDDTEDDASSVGLSFSWIGPGEQQSNGAKDYKMLEMTVEGKTSIITVGDCMLLRSTDETPPTGSSTMGSQQSRTRHKSVDDKDSDDDKEEDDDDGPEDNERESDEEEEAFVARIVRMWEVPPGRKKQLREHCMKIRARWFFKKQDVESLSGNYLGPMSRQGLLRNMTNRDLILSNQTDDNDVLTLLAKCNVISRNPSPNDRIPEGLPHGTFVSRYSINFDNNGSAVLSAYDGENQPWPEPTRRKKLSAAAAAAAATSREPTPPPPKEQKENDSAPKDATGDEQTLKEKENPVDEIEVDTGRVEEIGLKDTAVVKADEAKEEEEEGMNNQEDKQVNDHDVLMADVREDENPSDQKLGLVARAKQRVSNKHMTKTADSVGDGLQPDDKKDIDAESTSSDDSSSTTFESVDDEQDNDQAEKHTSRSKYLNHVGPDYQVPVKPFKAKQTIVSRNPVLVWEAGKRSSNDIQTYFDRAAEILVNYSEQNHLLVEAPYVPLPLEQTERFVSKEELRDMTLSSVSTASAVTKSRNRLPRECNIDALLATLHQEGEDLEKALKKIQSSPREYLTAWSKSEKELFNAGFRRYAGSLRMFSRLDSSSKNFKDVIDYHYRFKIPDQFRRFQDMKREYAVRMMELVDNRRTEETVIPLRRGDEQRKLTKWKASKPKGREWSKTGMADVVGAAEGRRVAAKELLLQIQEAMGSETMALIAEAVKTLHGVSSSDLKERAVGILREQPHLLERFLGFLPKRFRTI